MSQGIPATLPLAVIIALGFILVPRIVSWYRGKRIENFAGARGWRYQKNTGEALDRYPLEYPFWRRQDRKARHLVQFAHEGFHVESFEFSYTEGKYRHPAHMHVTSIVIPHDVPFLQSRPENARDPVRRFFGAEDTQFEAADFNAMWLVHGEVREFPRDVVSPPVTSWLEERRGRTFSLDRRFLCGYAGHGGVREEVLGHADRLLEAYRVIPGDAWRRTAPGRWTKGYRGWDGNPSGGG